jgi:hypothetical protein
VKLQDGTAGSGLRISSPCASSSTTGPAGAAGALGSIVAGSTTTIPSPVNALGAPSASMTFDLPH